MREKTPTLPPVTAGGGVEDVALFLLLDPIIARGQRWHSDFIPGTLMEVEGECLHGDT